MGCHAQLAGQLYTEWSKKVKPAPIFTVRLRSIRTVKMSALEIRVGIIKRYRNGLFTYLLTSHGILVEILSVCPSVRPSVCQTRVL